MRFYLFYEALFGWYLLTHYYFMSVVRHDGKYLHFFEVIVLNGFFGSVEKRVVLIAVLFWNEWFDGMMPKSSFERHLMVSQVLFKQLPFDVLHKRSTIK